MGGGDVQRGGRGGATRGWLPRESGDGDGDGAVGESGAMEGEPGALGRSGLDCLPPGLAASFSSASVDSSRRPRRSWGSGARAQRRNCSGHKDRITRKQHCVRADITFAPTKRASEGGLAAIFGNSSQILIP
jgi:hypothetical protein